MLNIRKRSVYRLVDLGAFICAKFGGSLRVEADSLDHYIKKQIEQFIFLHGQCEYVEKTAPTVTIATTVHGEKTKTG